MAGLPPFLLTVYDLREARLLRVRECPSEAAMAELALEEQEMYARFPHVEIECHWGRPVAEVREEFSRRRVRAPIDKDGLGAAPRNGRA